MGLPTTLQQANATFFLYTTRQLFCVVSQYQCAGNPSLRNGNYYRAVVPAFKEGWNNKQANGASLHLRVNLKRRRNFHIDYNIQLVRYVDTRVLETMPLQ